MILRRVFLKSFIAYHVRSGANIASTIQYRCMQSMSLSNDHCDEWIKALDLRNEKVPSFNLKGENISVLKKPADFYDALHKGISNSKKRITIASLYLGTDHLEKKLVTSMLKSVEGNQESLKVKVLLDHTRGSRGEVNSRTMLLPLVKNYPDNAKVAFYYTPLLRGLTKMILPVKMNESLSVTHLKVYLFDDTLIMSGANLSNDYFTNRQDRYIVFNNSPSLCDYFDDLVDTVSKFCLNLHADGSTVLSETCPVHPETGSKEAFCEYAAQQMQRFIEHYCSGNAVKTSKEEDTVVYPLLQMNHFNIHQDAKVTCNLLEHCPADSEVSIATAYLNIPPLYWDYILHAKAKMDIILAHPEAMGFYGAQGIIGEVPNAYTLMTQDLFNSLKGNDRKRVTFYEFLRKQWTFHGKGLWAKINNSNEEYLTLIGSPNFGYRSVYRDLEAQILIVTGNKTLKEELEFERLEFYQYCEKVTESILSSRVAKLWVKLFRKIFYSFF